MCLERIKDLRPMPKSQLLGFLGTGPRTIKGRPAQTNRDEGPGRGRSKPLRRGDQTKAMTVDKRARRRVVEYVQLVYLCLMGERPFYRRRFWWRWSLETGILSTLPRPKGEEEAVLYLGPTDEYSDGGSGELSGDDLARSHGLVLPRSRGFGDKQPLERSRATSSGAPLSFGTFRLHYCAIDPVPTSYFLLGRLVNQLSAMSKRLKLSDLAKVVAKKAATSASKGVVISEGSETTSGKRALDDGSKGKQVAQSPEPKKARIDTGASGASARPPVTSGAGSSARQVLSEALGPQASVMASAATAEKILAGVVLPADKEKVDRLTFDQVVTKFLHVVGQGVILGSSLVVRSRDFAEGTLNQKAEKAKGRKLAEDVDARGKVISKLEARIFDLEKSQSLTQGRIIAAFKESDDFLEAVRGSASSYFGDGFDFCKRQLAKQYPDLGVDLEDVEMDQELLAKEEAEAEKRTAKEEAAEARYLLGEVPPRETLGEVEHQRTLSRRHVDGKFNAGQVESAGKWSNGGNDGFYTSEIGTSRDLGRWARSITALPCVYINAVNLFIRTFPLLSKCSSVSDSHLAANKSTVPFMSFNTNLGGEESEQSLPSWISDHLGAKSYIDETNQSTSSPPIPTNSSKMDTSSLNKESNVMSQVDLDNLGTTCSFPQGVRLRIPGDGETILSARQGKVAFYEAAFLAGLRFPIHPTIREILIHYKICPAQLSPNAWRSVICSLVIWRIFKRHLSFGEFRCLYSLSPLPDSGWYYFKARPEKNLLRGSPSNVKGWKTRFFFASGDEWELAPGTAASESSLRVPRSWGTPGKSCNKLPTLSEVDAKRMEAVFGKIEPGGYFEVSKVLNSRTFKRHFAGGCSALSTSGGDNTTSGDEGEFGTGEDSVEYLGVIRRGIGGAIRRALPAMSARGKAVAEKAKKATAAKHPTKGVGIREKRMREGDLVIEIGEEDSLKGKETVPPPPPKRFKSNRGAINARGRAAEAGTSSPAGDGESESMSDASVARRLLTGVIPASDKKEVDQLSENDLVVVFTSSLALRSQEHLHDIDFHMARADSAELELVKAQKRAVKAETRLAELNEEISRPGTEVDDLKTTVAELTSKLAKAKELAIEDFKASEEFKAAVTDSAATYFSDGFEFCKRQLLHQFPNLGADVANMAMDPSFAEEEEATKEGGDHV
ncbi:hypothetical protein Acr_22g0002740 [Actinidia rufa]|uniref:Transposase (putative) gypsy type domain-containing protein n=1 Tax=Actinidia rufa TaxID=165716 RepID=A0A7J0GJ89_9ERIC|nr:hypothetical protein Acr_22g0002740 [Actinidia rufa]